MELGKFFLLTGTGHRTQTVRRGINTLRIGSLISFPRRIYPETMRHEVLEMPSPSKHISLSRPEKKFFMSLVRSH